MPVTAAGAANLGAMVAARNAVAAATACVALLLTSHASAAPQQERSRHEPVAAADVAQRVLAISVDGLNPDAIRRLGRAGAPTFYRLLSEGAGTLNARTEVEQNVTLPNHTSMLTSRRIDARLGGHGVTWDDDRPRTTVQQAAGHAVDSVFTQVHRDGDATALFSTKEKFALYDRSWPDDIDLFHVDENQGRLVAAARSDLLTTGRAFTFLHVSLPDRTGHTYGGMTPRYVEAVRTTDRQLGTILRALDRRPDVADGLTVVLTADHGFLPGRTTHTPRTPADYRIPFVVWGAGVTRGDLYDLNPDYADPGRRRPSYDEALQPVRNGDLGNLSLDLLGLQPIPGSELDADYSLDVQ